MRASCVFHAAAIQMKVLDTSLRIAKAWELPVMQSWRPRGHIEPVQDPETSRLNNSLHAGVVLDGIL